MRNQCFYLNYGAITETPALVFSKPGAPMESSGIISANQAAYGLRRILLKTNIKGLAVTVIAQGPHRSLEVRLDLQGYKASRRQYLNDLPQSDSMSQKSADRRMAWCESAIKSIPQKEALAMYGQLLDLAQKLVRTPYNVVKHNCVTAVAAILHNLDDALCADDLILPSTLDSRIRRYCQSRDIKPVYTLADQETLALFFRLYRDEVGPAGRRPGVFAKKCYFELNWMESASDIVHHLYGLNSNYTGGRTKNVLVRNNWINPKKRGGLYSAASSAPEDFKLALAVCNKELLAHKRRETRDLDYSEQIFGFDM